VGNYFDGFYYEEYALSKALAERVSGVQIVQTVHRFACSNPSFFSPASREDAGRERGLNEALNENAGGFMVKGK
jgi:hypothetical protein